MSPVAALLVIDMQNAMVAISHRASATVATIAGLRKRAKAAGVPIVTVQHRGEGLEAGTEDWRIVPELVPSADEAVIHKTSADSFLNTDLDGTSGRWESPRWWSRGSRPRSAWTPRPGRLWATGTT